MRSGQYKSSAVYVICREVVLFSEVQNISKLRTVKPIIWDFEKCPLQRGPYLAGCISAQRYLQEQKESSSSLNSRMHCSSSALDEEEIVRLDNVMIGLTR